MIASLLVCGALTGAALAQDAEPAPPSKTTVLDRVSEHEDFSVLAKAIRAAGLDRTLTADGPLTLLAPNDDAFADLEGADAILADPRRLATLLKRHVIVGRALTADDFVRSKVRTAGGEELRLKIRADGTARFGEAVVTATDFFADNGVVHIVDRVIVP